MKSFNSPKRFWSTTNTSRSGVRITLRWSSAWWALNEVPAVQKVLVILKPHSTRNSFPNSGKLAHISMLAHGGGGCPFAH